MRTACIYKFSAQLKIQVHPLYTSFLCRIPLYFMYTIMWQGPSNTNVYQTHYIPPSNIILCTTESCLLNQPPGMTTKSSGLEILSSRIINPPGQISNKYYYIQSEHNK